MKQDRGWATRGALLAAAAASIAFAGSASAQIGSGETPGAALRRQLAELAANPSSVSELVETGRAALTVGDGEGALGFFTRAAQLAPRDARVKAGLAAANARTGRPETALMLFAEAQALGAAAGEIAGERGLAYDLLGQTARAQQDYLVSLRHREDVEVRRRLALSLAISGQRDAALRLIESQVRLGDRAAARTRVMVLALTGDANGATAAAHASLPPGAAQSLSPFLARLASMTPGQMAAAANLGRVSGSGGLRATGTARAPADPGALAFAGGGAPPASLAARLPVAPAASDGVRRRQGVVNSARSAARQPLTTSDRVLASSSTPVTPPREAGEPRGSWAGVASSAAARPVATASLAEPFLQPHPHQPLRLAANVAVPGATSAPLGGTGGPGLPGGTAPASGAPPVPTTPNAAASAAASFTLPARGSASSAGLTDNAATNLAVWTTGASASPAASAGTQGSAATTQAIAAVSPEPVAAAVAAKADAPRPVELASVQTEAVAAAGNPAAAAASASTGFSDVVALVSGLETEKKAAGEAKPAASPAKPDSADAGATTRSRTAARSAAASERKAASTRAVKAEERKATSAGAAKAEEHKATSARAVKVEERKAASARAVKAEERKAATSARAAKAEERKATSMRTEKSEERTTSSTRAAGKSGSKAAATRTAAPAHPSRIWVQLAVSPNRSAFGFDMNRLRKAAPELLKDRTPHVAPIGSNHRLLIGPFASEAAARSLVNDLKKKDISSVSWTSPAGTEVERLPTRR